MNLIQQACRAGEGDVTVLYTKKSPLNWSPSTYGYLMATNNACLGLATFVLLPSLSRFFRLSDITLVAVGLAFKAVRLAMLSYGQYTWMIFVAVIVGCPNALVVSSSRSLVSKLVAEDEQGKVFSLLSCGESVASVVGGVVFALVYRNAVGFMPGLVYLLDCALTVVLLYLVHAARTELG